MTPLCPQLSQTPPSETPHLCSHSRSKGLSNATIFWPSLLQIFYLVFLPFAESFSNSPPASKTTSQSAPPQLSFAPATKVACALNMGAGKRGGSLLCSSPPAPTPSTPGTQLLLGPRLHPHLSPRPFPSKVRKAHLKDLASAQSVHVRGHEEKNPLSGEERTS